MTGRHLTVWALVFALCVYGWTSVTVQLLGSAHSHVASPAALSLVGDDLMTRTADTFRKIREWRSSLYERLGVKERPHQHADGSWHIGNRVEQSRQAPNANAPSQAHAHLHLSFQRHHHVIGDPTVVAIDAAAGDTNANAGSSASAFGVALMPLGLLQLFSPVRSVTDARWPHAPGARWSDAMVSPLDRPPHS